MAGGSSSYVQTKEKVVEMERRKKRAHADQKTEEDRNRVDQKIKSGQHSESNRKPHDATVRGGDLLSLQNGPGNMCVQKIVARLQKQGDELPHESSLEHTIHDLHSRQGAGQELDPDTKAEMEGAFGHDLSEVRLHTDSAASDAADSLNAKAFTMGTDIYFSDTHSGDLSSTGGKELLAHELAHVMQQSSGKVDLPGDSVKMGEPGDAYETAADRTAEAVVRGEGIQKWDKEDGKREKTELLQKRPESGLVQKEEPDEQKSAELAARRAAWDSVLGQALLLDTRARAKPSDWNSCIITAGQIAEALNVYEATYPDQAGSTQGVREQLGNRISVLTGALADDELLATLIAGMYDVASGFAPSLPHKDDEAPAPVPATGGV